MPHASIAERLEDYFRRQIDLFERMAEARSALPEDTQSPGWEDAQRRQEAFARELEALEEEFRILKREWDATPDLSSDEQQRMREWAVRAGDMAGRAVRASAHDAEQASQMLRDLKEQRNALQQGKRLLGRLRAGERNDTGYFDEKT